MQVYSLTNLELTLLRKSHFQKVKSVLSSYRSVTNFKTNILYDERLHNFYFYTFAPYENGSISIISYYESGNKNIIHEFKDDELPY